MNWNPFKRKEKKKNEQKFVYVTPSQNHSGMDLLDPLNPLNPLSPFYIMNNDIMDENQNNNSCGCGNNCENCNEKPYSESNSESSSDYNSYNSGSSDYSSSDSSSSDYSSSDSCSSDSGCDCGSSDF